MGYLPEYRRPDGVLGAVKRNEQLDPEEVGLAVKFTGGKDKGLWNESHFRDVPFLLKHNRK